MKLSSLVSHVCEVLSSIVRTFPEGGAVSSVPPDGLIASFFRSRKYLGSHDRRFIAETTYGTIRHLRRIDKLLGSSRAPRGPDDPPGHLRSRVLAYLLLIDEARTEERTQELLTAFGQEAAGVHARREAQAGESPRSGDVAAELADRYSFEPWMVQEFIRRFGAAEAEQLCRCLNEQAPLTLRANTLKTNPETLLALLRSHGIESCRTRNSPLGLLLTRRVNVFTLEPFREGLFEVQDEGSQLIPLVIDPKPNAKVLDACAGAGGKTLELAALMKNRGEIVAADISTRRLEELRKRARRAGAHNIRIRSADLTEAPLEDAHGSFDVVLVDAPCSGTGTIRRNPGLKWTVSEPSVAELAQKQLLLLTSAAEAVKPGGVLWYCTCSMLSRENEEVVERFLARSPSFALRDPSSSLAKLGLSDALSGSAIHLLPHRHGTDGFFCASLERLR